MYLSAVAGRVIVTEHEKGFSSGTPHLLQTVKVDGILGHVIVDIYTDGTMYARAYEDFPADGYAEVKLTSPHELTIRRV